MKKEKILNFILAIILGTTVAVGTVSAATTVGTDIATDGVLTVSGTASSSFLGAVGIGTTTPKSALQIGDVGNLFTYGQGIVNFDIARNAYYDAGLPGWRRTTADPEASMIELQQPGSNNIAFYASTDNSNTPDSVISWSQMMGLSITGVRLPNKAVVGGSTFGSSKMWVNGNMSIGSGYSAAAPTNGLLVQGNVGIGTTTPTEMLDIGSNNIRIRTAKTPSSASEACDQGEISWDANYTYVCVATNTWKRSALTTW